MVYLSFSGLLADATVSLFAVGNEKPVYTYVLKR